MIGGTPLKSSIYILKGCPPLEIISIYYNDAGPTSGYNQLTSFKKVVHLWKYYKCNIEIVKNLVHYLRVGPPLRTTSLVPTVCI